MQSITGEMAMHLLRNMTSSVERLLTSIGTGVLAFFAPIETAVICAISFILIDAVLGYAVSRKYNHKEIESNKIWKTILKMTEATILIGGAHTIDMYVVTSINLHAVEFASGIICGTEFWSWLESMIDLNPKNRLWRLISKIISKVIKAKGEKYLNTDIDLEQLNKEVNDDIKHNNKCNKRNKKKR